MGSADTTAGRLFRFFQILVIRYYSATFTDEGLTSPMTRQRMILVVDDERTIREVVRRYLELEGFAVTEAETGPQALSILQSQPPDLVVLDIMLPGVDGFSITRRLRHPSEFNPLRIEGEIPIVLLTARTNEVDRVAGLELGGG